MNYEIECPKHGKLSISTRQKKPICPICDGPIKIIQGWKQATPFSERLNSVQKVKEVIGK